VNVRTPWWLAVIPSLAIAAPPCCKLFGLDASPILGDDAAICGAVVDADDRSDAEELARANRKQAAECARAAQADGRAYVYTYRQLIWPDVDMVVQAVTGTRGERLLLMFGNSRGENIRTAEVCAMLEVRPGGRVESRGCTPYHPLIERLRAPFPVR
jgi:hypothetical protein